MNRRISCLLIAVACPLLAQSSGQQGGGEVVLAGKHYRFEPDSLMASTTAVDGERALQLKGRLICDDPADALAFELVTFGAHEIYSLGLVRHEGTLEKARWNATMKTRVQVEAPEHPQAGDRATFKVEGPLVGTMEGPRHPTAWSGTFWAGFSVEHAP